MPMNHPSNEEWMGLLYGELDARSAAALEAHRRECPTCAGEVERWRATMARLEEDLPRLGLPHPARAPGWRPAVWAEAAVLVLSLGVAAGWAARNAGSTRELAALRGSLERRLESVRQELAAEAEAGRRAEAESFEAALVQLERRQVQRIRALRNDLEVIAYATDVSLEKAEATLAELAALNLEQAGRPAAE